MTIKNTDYYYKYVRENISSGDCILFKGNSLIPRAIRLFTEYSHTAIAFRFKRYQSLHERVFLIDSFYYGVRLTLLSDIIKKYQGNIYLYKLNDISDESRLKIETNSMILASSQIKYDYPGLFQNIFGRVNLNANRYFCSELTWDIWKNNNVFEDYKNLSKIGIQKFRNGVSPRPGDIIKWTDGITIKIK